MKEDRHFVTALSRGLSVLRCFTAEHMELGTTDIARLVGLSQSTVWRLCHTLQKGGYLVPGKDPERLRVGPAVLALGCASLSQRGIAEVAAPEMARIANTFQCSLSIAARDGLQMLIMGRETGSAVLKLNFHIGTALRIERSAVGCAYLAAIGETERASLMEQIEKAYPDEWEANRRYIEESVQMYRDHGYVLNLRRYHPDVNALGVPIVSPNGRQVIAMNCGGTSSVISREQLEGPIAQAMKDLAASLCVMLTV
ncbi:IclR family transcriptional regulator [Pollutimonas bauzanensis]|uniref:Transcriptional regulator, IclR family n=1 Tax=Pollutimonas bauzanensis TaxID=658167 RepID=A0A1M5USK1_9BURK|nr:IclR family transcriptional regulator [Pollutimonas bauzanensis]SHH65906.1 transcriptional regulator, IclR family [Pollutimonas bauzanensis]